MWYTALYVLGTRPNQLRGGGKMSEYAPEKNVHRAKKSMGQNFIADPTVCPRIAEMADIDGACVLEIGPGFGALTVEVAKRAEKVVAIELDSDVIDGLKENLKDLDNVTVIQGDALESDLKQLIKDNFGDRRVSAIGNIPYNITSPLIMKLIEPDLGLDSVTVMIQKEPADRFCAKPGTDGCGAVSVPIWYYGIPKKLFEVGPGAFRPRPKVRSAVIRIDLRKEPAVKVLNEEHFFRLVRAAFGQRRKTALNSVSSLMGIKKEEIAAAMDRRGIDQGIRAERMTMEQLAALSDELVAS